MLSAVTALPSSSDPLLLSAPSGEPDDLIDLLATNAIRGVKRIFDYIGKRDIEILRVNNTHDLQKKELDLKKQSLDNEANELALKKLSLANETADQEKKATLEKNKLDAEKELQMKQIDAENDIQKRKMDLEEKKFKAEKVEQKNKKQIALQESNAKMEIDRSLAISTIEEERKRTLLIGKMCSFFACTVPLIFTLLAKTYFCDDPLYDNLCRTSIHAVHYVAGATFLALVGISSHFIFHHAF